MAEPLVVFIAALACSWALTIVIGRLASTWALTDVPNERSSHTTVTPRGGGLAIAIAFVVCVASLLLRYRHVPMAPFVVLLGGSLALAAIGLADDRVGLSVSFRLSAQAAAVLTGLAVATVPWLDQGGIESTGLLVIVALCWMWFINLFNFMDGIDGLAASEAAFVCAGAIGILCLLDAPRLLVLAWVALGGASVGFLIHNWPPARIFMGDSGSGFLGFAIALLLVESSGVAGFSPWTAVILVAVFAADATVTLLRRIARGEPMSQGHRSHAYQRLARLWGSHRRVTRLCIAVNIVVSFPLALASVLAPGLAPVLAMAYLLLLSWAAWSAGAGLPD